MTYRKILIVDDEVDFVEQTKELINETYPNLDINTASNGLEAIEKCDNNSYNCIVCDIHMPKLNGPDFVAKIRTLKTNFSTPIIFVSGEPNIDLLDGLTFVTLLSKPFSSTDFINVLSNQMQLRSDSKRICASIFDLLLSELAGYISTKLGDSYAFSGITESTPDNYDSKYCVKLSLKIGQSKNTYLFNFNDKISNRLAEKVSSNKLKKNDILLHCITTARNNFLEKYNFQDLKFEDSRVYNQMDSKKIMKKLKGIKIDLNVGPEKIIIYATTGKVSLKDQGFGLIKKITRT